MNRKKKNCSNHFQPYTIKKKSKSRIFVFKDLMKYKIPSEMRRQIQVRTGTCSFSQHDTKTGNKSHLKLSKG